jgi:pimeloyl-ACP methyl ester carboxylesterase
MSTMKGSRAFVFLLCLATLAGCARLPPVDREALRKVETPSELQGQLLQQEPEIDVFRSTGPFAVTVRQNRPLQLSPKERIDTDLFVSAVRGAAPLAIFLHGHDSSKRAHARQAMHLASWGVHCLTVQLPNRGPWNTNGSVLARIASLIHRSPGVLEGQVDVNKIILVGFSFGASAVAVALAQRAPAAGGILLDPAAIGKDLPDLLRRIEKPVFVIGSDDEDYGTRDREYFFDFIRGSVAELSIRGAAHEDAQYPSDAALENSGVDPNTTEALQMSFVAALTSAAISLSATGTFDYAWESFAPAFESGKFFNPKKK